VDLEPPDNFGRRRGRAHLLGRSRLPHALTSGWLRPIILFLPSVLTQKFVKLFVTLFAVIPAEAGIQSL
jgi:hypothetical protein